MAAIDFEIDRLLSSWLKHTEEVKFFEMYATAPCREAIWTCKDGSTVKIKDMTTEHIKNTIALLERKSPDNKAILYLKQELAYREVYPEIKEALRIEEAVIDGCL